MAIIKGISQAIVDSLDKTLVFITSKGRVIARKWPKKSTHKRSTAELFNWEAMRAAESANKTLKPPVLTAYRLLATGTDFTWRDLFNSQFLKEYYKNKEAPCYVRDFSYTKYGPRIQIEYELSKESLVSVTRHAISKYGVVIPVGNKMCKPNCKGPPDPAWDEIEPQCEFSGLVDFSYIEEFGRARRVSDPGNEEGCWETWNRLKALWQGATWGVEYEDWRLAWYSYLWRFGAEWGGTILGKRIAQELTLTAETMGVALSDVTKAWIRCEGSENNVYISGFKCPETNDLVPLQRGKLAFGDLLPFLGLSNKTFHFQPIEMPDPPTKPPCPPWGQSRFSGGYIDEDTFKCKFCYEQKVSIPFINNGTPLVKKYDLPGFIDDWWECWWETYIKYEIEDWEIGNWQYFGIIGNGRQPHVGWYDASLGNSRWPIKYNIGDYMSEEEFETVKWGYIEVPREKAWENQVDGGHLITNLYSGKYPQVKPVTEVLLPVGVLTYPVTELILEGRAPEDMRELMPPEPEHLEKTAKGYSLPMNPELPLVLYQKGERGHVIDPPFNFDSPYWLKFSTQHSLEPVISPFFRIT